MSAVNHTRTAPDAARQSRRLSPEWFARPAPDVARDLLGKLLARSHRGKLISGRIVETEAYLPEGDPACHAARGPTRGNRSIFGAPGIAYVYPIHSRHCFNVVCGAEGTGTAVLVRALEPLKGIPFMVRQRKTERLRDLCRGPGRLCEALAIDRSLDGTDLVHGNTLWIGDPEAEEMPRDRIRVTPRIGVTSAEHLPLRFVIAASPWASGPIRLR